MLVYMSSYYATKWIAGLGDGDDLAVDVGEGGALGRLRSRCVCIYIYIYIVSLFRRLANLRTVLFCHTLPFRPILWSGHFPSEPVKPAKKSLPCSFPVSPTDPYPQKGTTLADRLVASYIAHNEYLACTLQGKHLACAPTVLNLTKVLSENKMRRSTCQKYKQRKKPSTWYLCLPLQLPITDYTNFQIVTNGVRKKNV